MLDSPGASRARHIGQLAAGSTRPAGPPLRARAPAGPPRPGDSGANSSRSPPWSPPDTVQPGCIPRAPRRGRGVRSGDGPARGARSAPTCERLGLGARSSTCLRARGRGRQPSARAARPSRDAGPSRAALRRESGRSRSRSGSGRHAPGRLSGRAACSHPAGQRPVGARPRRGPPPTSRRWWTGSRTGWAPSASFGSRPCRATCRNAACGPCRPSRRPRRASWPPRSRAPARLLDPAAARPRHRALPDRPPRAFVWRRVRHRIRRADGPERILGEWWRSDGESDGHPRLLAGRGPRTGGASGCSAAATAPTRPRATFLVPPRPLLTAQDIHGRRDHLRPATAEELAEALSFALRFNGRKPFPQPTTLMARDHRRAPGAAPRRMRLRAHAPPAAAAPSTSGHGHPLADKRRDHDRYAELQVTTHFSLPARRLACRGTVRCRPARSASRRSASSTATRWPASCARIGARAGDRRAARRRLPARPALRHLACWSIPTDRAAYSRLCRLLTLGKRRAGKGGCHLDWADVAEYGEGLLAILLPASRTMRAPRSPRLRRRFPATAPIWRSPLHRRPDDAVRLRRLADWPAAAARADAWRPATCSITCPSGACCRTSSPASARAARSTTPGFRRERHADRHLRPPDEMARLFAAIPDAVARTLEIADAAVLARRTALPIPRRGRATRRARRRRRSKRLTWARRAAAAIPDGVARRRRDAAPARASLIEQLDYAPYFLTVHSHRPLRALAGHPVPGPRQSAANSAVCFVLGITSIDPVPQPSLLFERFVSAERREPPDIDVDFEHERREEVIQWIYETYGRDRAALCATVIRYRARGAVREVGKALGLPEDVTGALASQVWGWSEEGVPRSSTPRSSTSTSPTARLRLTLDLSRQLIGFPRHLGQHPGGFVLTADRLDDLVPIEPAAMADRQVIEWDKDDIDALKLHEGRRARPRHARLHAPRLRPAREHQAASRHRPRHHPGGRPRHLRHDPQGRHARHVPDREPRADVDAAAHEADAPSTTSSSRSRSCGPGRSRATWSTPTCAGATGWRSRNIPRPNCERVLGKTLGVPLFQEQAMQVAIVCAGFTPGEADQLRRVDGDLQVHRRRVSHFRDKLIDGHGRATATPPSSPSAPSSRSRASAPTASPRATRPASR